MTKNMTQQEYMNWFMNNPNIPLPYKEMVQKNPQKGYAAYLQAVGGVEIPVEDTPKKPQTPSGIVGHYVLKDENGKSIGKGGGYVSRFGDWLERFRTGTIDFSGGRPTGGAAQMGDTTRIDNSNPLIDKAKEVRFTPAQQAIGELGKQLGNLLNNYREQNGYYDSLREMNQLLREKYSKGGN